MSGSDTLERVAQLLPEDQREKFFATIARCKTVPEDDEYLLVLEAIGFMTLLWCEVPNRIQDVLSGASPLGADHGGQVEYLVQEMRHAINASIDTPSHEDLRQLVHELKEQQNLFVHAMRNLGSQGRGLTPRPRSNGMVAWIALALSLVLCGVLVWKMFPQAISDLRWLRKVPESRAHSRGYSQASVRHDQLEDRVLCRRPPVVATDGMIPFGSRAQQDGLLDGDIAR